MKPARIIHGDCISVMQTLDPFDLCFADPPFGIGHGYVGFEDRWPNRKAYREWTFAWVAQAWRLTSGVLCLHGPDDLAEIYLRAARKMGFARRRVSWVNWHYRFGQCQRGNWIDARCHCLIFAAHDNYTWNPDAVLVESDRASVYEDPRIRDSPRGGSRVPGTVWGVPSDGPFWGRVQGNSKERRKGHPNQLPEKYLERLIRAYTNQGDSVLDPFCGSGTTPVVAAALGRRCVAIDVSLHNVKSARRRLKKGAVRVG